MYLIHTYRSEHRRIRLINSPSFKNTKVKLCSNQQTLLHYNKYTPAYLYPPPSHPPSNFIPHTNIPSNFQTYTLTHSSSTPLFRLTDIFHTQANIVLYHQPHATISEWHQEIQSLFAATTNAKLLGTEIRTFPLSWKCLEYYT